MKTPAMASLGKALLIGFGSPMIVAGLFVAALPAFAKQLGQPDALIASSFAMLLSILGAIGGLAALATMPAARYPEVSRWIFRSFVRLAKYQRDRAYPSYWLAEALGIYAYFSLQLFREHRGPDGFLSPLAIAVLALVFVPVWKMFWMFLTFTLPVFLMRAIAPQERIRNTQRRLRIGMFGIRSRFAFRYTSLAFWLGSAGVVVSAFAGQQQWLVDYVATPALVISLGVPFVSLLGRLFLSCEKLGESRLGRKGRALCRLLLFKAT